jgi:hypothetical protein
LDLGVLASLGQPLSLSLPPDLAGSLGYPCVPAERFVCFYHGVIDPHDGLALFWHDGMIWSYADQDARAVFTEHPGISSSLNAYCLGGAGARGARRPSEHALLIDTQTDLAYALPVDVALAYPRAMAGEGVRQLGAGVDLTYLRTANGILSTPLRFTGTTKARVTALQAWLDTHVMPF